jgi:hypothetical protein
MPACRILPFHGASRLIVHYGCQYASASLLAGCQGGEVHVVGTATVVKANVGPATSMQASQTLDPAGAADGGHRYTEQGWVMRFE